MCKLTRNGYQDSVAERWHRGAMGDDKKGTAFESLMSSQGPTGLPTAAALERIGLLIDLAGDLNREDGTARALLWSDELARQPLSDADAALLEYFRANAWANRQAERHAEPTTVWAWEQPELQQQIL